MANAKKNSLGSKVVKIRMLANLSQAELGKLVGTDQTRVSFWETGRNVPTKHFKKLIALGKKYGVEFNLDDVVNRG